MHCQRNQTLLLWRRDWSEAQVGCETQREFPCVCPDVHELSKSWHTHRISDRLQLPNQRVLAPGWNLGHPLVLARARATGEADSDQ